MCATGVLPREATSKLTLSLVVPVRKAGRQVGHPNRATGGIERAVFDGCDCEKYCEKECNHGGETSLAVRVVKIDHMLRYLSTNDTGTPALSVITA